MEENDCLRVKISNYLVKCNLKIVINMQRHAINYVSKKSKQEENIFYKMDFEFRSRLILTHAELSDNT